jgi:hypothetical protein
MLTDSFFQAARWYQVDCAAQHRFKGSAHLTQTDQAHARRDIGQQVYIAVRAILAAGHAPEDSQVRHTVRSGGGGQVPSGAANSAPDRTGEPGQPTRLTFQRKHRGRPDGPFWSATDA